MIASEGYTSSKFSASSGFRLAPAGFNDMLVEVEEIIWAGGFGGGKGTECLKVQDIGTRQKIVGVWKVQPSASRLALNSIASLRGGFLNSSVLLPICMSSLRYIECQSEI